MMLDAACTVSYVYLFLLFDRQPPGFGIAGTLPCTVENRLASANLKLTPSSTPILPELNGVKYFRHT